MLHVKNLYNFVFVTLMSVLPFFPFVTRTAQASVIDSEQAWYINLHHGLLADGKEVKNVLAHVGVEKKHEIFLGRPTTWENIKDIPLVPNGSGFTARVSLHCRGYDGSITSTQTPLVQYFVTFTDGTSTISPVYVIKNDTKLFRVDYQDEISSFVTAAMQMIEAPTEPTATEVVMSLVTYGRGFEPIANAEQLTGILKLFP